MDDNHMSQTNSESQNIKHEDTPDHYYDSDIASVNEKDFLSDNEPPKDIAQERKLLYKEKFLHVFKTIIGLGYGIDKPAKYDLITLTYKQLQPNQSIKLTSFEAMELVVGQPVITYNLGYDNEHIERLVTSMRPTQLALFQREELETSSQSNLKVLKERKNYLVKVEKWTTVIDIDADRKYLKYIWQKGEGPYRVHEFDEVAYSLNIQSSPHSYHCNVPITKIEKETIHATPHIVWKLLTSMKKNQQSSLEITEGTLKQIQPQTSYQNLLQKLQLQEDHSADRKWKFTIKIQLFNKIDDVYLDGRILKKTIAKGVSTSKPDQSSLIYYALTFLNPKDKTILSKDSCFDSDWWEDYSKLQLLNCRKNYLDDYRVSKMLKDVIERMKPAQIAQVECRDMNLFKFGDDYDEYCNLLNKHGLQLGDRYTVIIRLYNFTEGKTCFNMELEEKINESKRKKAVAIKLLNEGNIQKALKRFQSIVSFYAEGKINQEAYDEKISALMNSILCLMKLQKYNQMIPLCNLVIEKPKHGSTIKDIKIHGPKNYKVQNNQQSQEEDNNNEQVIQLDKEKNQEIDIGVKMNQKIVDKCLYRKAFALSQIGENSESLKVIQQISEKNSETEALKQQVEKRLQQYVQKSKKIFKSMFS